MKRVIKMVELLTLMGGYNSDESNQLIKKAKEAERERILQDTEQEGEMELE